MTSHPFYNRLLLSFLFLTLTTADAMTPIQFKQLSLPSSPNTYLVCPPGYCQATAHQQSLTYPIPVGELQALMHQTVMAQPRIKLMTTANGARQAQYVQRSLIFRFPDFIDIEYIELGEHQSTLAIYSRSKYGHSDFGVNKKRITRWLNALQANLKLKLKKSTTR